MQGQAELVLIRRATREDAEGILACLREAFEEFRSLYTHDGFLDTVLTSATLKKRLASMSVFVAVNAENKIVGTIACSMLNAEEGHLRGMAVLLSIRGSGIAAQLLRHAESDLRSRNCGRITLDTTEPLQRAMRFYERCGYRRSGKVSDFFGMPLIEYEKILSEETLRGLDTPPKIEEAKS